MNYHNPIGVFDSGVGGLSVVKQLRALLPGENVVYFGDTAHVPYGGRSHQELLRLGERILTFLTNSGCKIIVAACNTSSAVSIPVLKERYSIPILTVLDPGAGEAARVTRNRRIGVIATSRTVESGAYPERIQRVDAGVQVFQSACPAFVPLVERGMLEGPEVEEAIAEYLSPLLRENIDTLVLGCTHYPYLVPALRRYLPAEVTIFDPALPTVAALRTWLEEKELLNDSREGEYRFYCSGSAQSFYNVAPRMLGREIDRAEVVNLDS